MGKNKLRKFADMKQISFVYEYPFARLLAEGFPHRGNWSGTAFGGRQNPLVLELGCGKGEYTVGLGRQYPGQNFVGIDIKGARMWTGATQARDAGMTNVAFLRTDIEAIDRFFAPGEVDEIWITFPDPQMKKVRKRLTSTRFLELYRRILRPGGIINLKTDSPFLYTYTRELIRLNGLPLLADSADLHGDPAYTGTPLTQIRTHYDSQWLDRGLTIKYLRFSLPADTALVEPDIEIPYDTYRSYSRGQIQGY